jgi:hypothetical protein
MKKQRIWIVGSICIAIIVGLTACGTENKKTECYISYLRSDPNTDVMMVEEKAFEIAETVSEDKIDRDIPKEIYAAKFGFKTVKNIREIIYEPKSDDPLIEIQLQAENNKCYAISDQDGKVTLNEIPRGVLDDEYLKSLFKDVNDSNISEFIDTLAYNWKHDEEMSNIQCTLVKYNLENTKRGKCLMVYTAEGYEISFYEDDPGRVSYGQYDMEDIQ